MMNQSSANDEYSHDQFLVLLTLMNSLLSYHLIIRDIRFSETSSYC